MRYFRYNHTCKNLNNALTDQYKSLIRCEKRILQKEKIWRRFSAVLSFIIFIAAVTAGFFLLKSIPQSDGWFWNLLAGIGKMIAGCFILVVGGIVTAGLTAPLWEKVESLHPSTMKKNILSQACGHLRDYYGVQEPYLITKCFDSSDKRFQNHDVCIFLVGNELRITTDLIQGFLYDEKDLGCYAFTETEIALSKWLCEKRLMVEMKADTITFLLGYRAKSFIEREFIETKSAESPTCQVDLGSHFRI